MASESGGDHGGMSGSISHHLHHLSSEEQHSLIDFTVVQKDTLLFLAAVRSHHAALVRGNLDG